MQPPSTIAKLDGMVVSLTGQTSMRSSSPIFPAIPSAAHRPLIGSTRRVKLSSCRVEHGTQLTLAAWRDILKCSQGRAIDQLVEFAKVHNFIPETTQDDQQ